MFTRKSDKENQTVFEVTKTDEEWKDELSPERYAVLRRAGTEPAWSGELLHVDGEGVFHCAGCDAELFDTDAKFDSGSGWPSFDRARAAGTIDRAEGPQLRHGADRDPLRPVRRPPGARVPRWTHRHRTALLRQLALPHLRAGRREGRRGLRLGEPPLHRAEEGLEALGLVVEAEPAQQRAAQRQRAADLDDLVPQEADRRS